MAVYYAEGDYNVECKELAFGRSKKGKPMIVLKVQVLDSVAEDGSFVPESKQYERTIYMTCDPEKQEVQDRIMEQLRHAGWQGAKFENLPKEMVGVQFVATCKHSENKNPESEYFGKLGESWWLWSEKPASKPLENDPTVSREMNALFGKRLKETAPKAPPKKDEPEPSPAYAGTGDDSGPPPDDEVPF